MGIREKEGKEKEESGAALPPQIVWNIVSKYKGCLVGNTSSCLLLSSHLQ